jgi:hypothetical protein
MMFQKNWKSSTFDTLSLLLLGMVIGATLTAGRRHRRRLGAGGKGKQGNINDKNDSNYVDFYEQERRERLPDLVILVRHGQSEGNVDKTMWWKKPDNQIALTSVGIEQATQAGRRIEKVFQFYEQTLGVPMDRIHVHVSPFRRTIQTARYARKAFEHRVVRQNLCPRLREQEFGNTQSADFKAYREEQKRVGRFWYRFPTGESGADGKEVM